MTATAVVPRTGREALARVDDATEGVGVVAAVASERSVSDSVAALVCMRRKSNNYCIYLNNYRMHEGIAPALRRPAGSMVQLTAWK